MEFLQPKGWPRAKGFAYGVATRGKQIFVSGTIGSDASGRLIADDFCAQAKQALRNIVQILAEAGAHPEHVARMTWYVLDKGEYLAAHTELGAIYREVMGNHFPAMTAVQVAGLVDEGARVEIEVTAVVPE